MRISDWSSDVCSSDLCQALSKADQAAYEDCADDWFATESGCRAKHPVRPARDCALPAQMAQQIDGAREQRKAECLEIGRASGRERGCQYVYSAWVADSIKNNNRKKRQRQ